MTKSIRTDLTGKVYGKWQVLTISIFRNRTLFWLCRCACGKEKFVNKSSLVRKLSTSCGKCNPNSLGMANTKIYQLWSSMFSRCYNKNHIHYENYGGRGITICKEWEIFSNFYNDMGDRPDGMTLDRIDNDGNYEPSNCRWATHKQQANNTRFNRIVEYRGKSYTVAELSRLLKINYTTLKRRIDHGRPLDAPVQ